MSEAAFEGWAILELMGHRRLGGRVSEQKLAGAPFIRIDVPGDGDDVIATQFYSPAAVFCCTPTTEAMARAVAHGNRPAPVQRWELQLPPAARDDDDDDDDDDDELDDIGDVP